MSSDRKHSRPQSAAVTRREFLAAGLSAAAAIPLAGKLGSALLAAPPENKPGKRMKVAAVITEFTHRSHAHVIMENFLVPYLFNGQKVDPTAEFEIVGMYIDQFPEGEMGRAVGEKFKVPIYPTIHEALCLGGKQLAVDAVMSIGEHGQYPTNAKGQHEYPRKRFFDEIAAVVEKSDRGIPIFNDKHLSYRWDWAKEMYDTAARLKMPFMAGSSVPLAERRPPLELPAGARIANAVSVHGGDVESYDFHALEVLQSQVEARQGGETGVAAVQFLSADNLWKAADEDLWSVPLAEAAMRAELGPDIPPLKELCASGKLGSSPPHGVLVTYRSGLRAIALKIGDSGIRWNFACQLEGENSPRATAYNVGPWQNRNLFKALSHAIQAHFRDGRAPYPVERTLLVTGVLDASMDSRYRGEVPVETANLAISYQPRDFRAMREMGSTWKIITDDIPEPEGINPIKIDT